MKRKNGVIVISGHSIRMTPKQQREDMEGPNRIVCGIHRCAPKRCFNLHNPKAYLK